MLSRLSSFVLDAASHRGDRSGPDEAVRVLVDQRISSRVRLYMSRRRSSHSSPS
ncbi:Hypothetical protein A7982_02936 [Minicystis rosea]|nr:Hypothetical protein A7982_02936 [Minicystis rosea]